MGQLRGLIFDVDGTLAETEEYHRRSFNDAFRKFGIPWSWDHDLYLELLKVTGGKERISHYQSDYMGESQLTPKVIQEIHEYKSARYDEYVSSGAVCLRPGVARLIHEARRENIALAIATTTSLSNVTSLLRFTLGDEAPSYFRVIAAGDMVKKKKPSSEVFDLALTLLELGSDEVVAIEDSNNGLRSSLGAKIATVITMSSFSTNHDFGGAAAVVDCLGDVDEPCHVLSGPAAENSVLNIRWFARLIE